MTADIDDLIRRAEALAATGGWLPIESAPRDGTRILAGQFDGTKKQFRHRAVTWWRDAKAKAAYIGWGEFNSAYWPPTHWKPLDTPDQPDPLLTALVAALSDARAESARLREALGQAGTWFREYEASHRAKLDAPFDDPVARRFVFEKAERNRERAEFCALLATAKRSEDALIGSPSSAGGE